MLSPCCQHDRPSSQCWALDLICRFDFYKHISWILAVEKWRVGFVLPFWCLTLYFQEVLFVVEDDQIWFGTIIQPVRGLYSFLYHALRQHTAPEQPPGLTAAGVCRMRRSWTLWTHNPSSQSNFLSAGVAVGCGSDDGRSGRGLLDRGETYVGGAVHVAGLALGAGTSTTSKLTEEEEEEEEEEGVKWVHKVSARPNSTPYSAAESTPVVVDEKIPRPRWK